MSSCIEVKIVHVLIRVRVCVIYIDPNKRIRLLMKRDIIVACECRYWIDEVCIVFTFLCIFFCVRLVLALLFQSAIVCFFNLPLLMLLYAIVTE